MSLTTQVFGPPGYRRWWIYYIVNDTDQLSKALNRPDHLVVFMFSAEWNEPCKAMKKPFRDMARARKMQAVFCLVDIDKLKDAVAQQFQVEALPTFVLYKNGIQKGRVVGAKVDDLRAAIDSNI
ncbi:Thioredoxin H2-2 [Zea mays]|uniref:Thioredoxin H2-2 n=1 Tax=Zea mays TaxID=4577 RepID=A0A3L6F5C3_MAIZE|nr:Thioredoxin H2-2 [Zea mays]